MEYRSKTSSNIWVNNNNIENVGYGLAVGDDSVNNLFHSNTVIDIPIKPIFEDDSSIGNSLDNNDKIVNFGTLKYN